MDKINGIFNYQRAVSPFIYANFDINSVDDIKNRRLNAPGTSANWLADTGCTPVDGALTTYYTDIQTGVSEGTLSFASGIQPTRVYEVAPHLTRVGFGSMYFGGIAVNKRFFDNLPEPVQTVRAGMDCFAKRASV